MKRNLKVIVHNKPSQEKAKIMISEICTLLEELKIGGLPVKEKN